MKYFLFIYILFLNTITLHAEPNKLHPLFPLLDEKGNKILSKTGSISSDQTCGKCHDVEYIKSTSHHYKRDKNLNCMNCHFESGEIDWKQGTLNAQGELSRETLFLNAPKNENCGKCHGIVHEKNTPLEIPIDFYNKNYYKITKQTGEIFSYQKKKDSFLNLQNKSKSTESWDIHSERQVECIDCHFSSNNPKKTTPKETNELKHLKSDPRTASFSEFIAKPDHTLTSLNCNSCHDPLQIHDMIPYKAKHMERVACQSCHVPSIQGPVLREVNNTILDSSNQLNYSFRNISESKNGSLNAQYIKSFRPYLLPSKDNQKLQPYNAVTEWNWIDQDGKKIDLESISAIQFPKEEKNQLELLQLFDTNQNKKIESNEWALDTNAKYEYFQNRLKSLGHKEPIIKGEIHFFPIFHSIQNGEKVTRDCNQCHSANSALSESIPIGTNLPGRKILTLGENSTYLNLFIELNTTDKEFVAKRILDKSNFYLFGFSNKKWPDRIGILFFILTLIGIIFHLVLRILKSPPHDPEAYKGLKVSYIYTFYERLWHWTSAFGIIILLISGFKIHAPEYLPLFNLTFAVYLHNIFAFILIANAFLSFFYHIASAEIKQYLPPLKSLWSDSFVQMKYYMSGIFKGEPHPIEKTRNRKLNPLQQITYLAILNILLPIQVITGVLIWFAGKWPSSLDWLGANSILAPIHTICSWMFLAFLFMHVYLTTTGRTWFSNIQAMVVGFDRVSSKEPS